MTQFGGKNKSGKIGGKPKGKGKTGKGKNLNSEDYDSTVAPNAVR